MRTLRRWVVLGWTRLRGTPRFTCGLALILSVPVVEEGKKREERNCEISMRFGFFLLVELRVKISIERWSMRSSIVFQTAEARYLHFHFYSFSSPKKSSVAAPSTDCQIVQWEHSSTSSIVRPFAPELRYHFCRSDERSVAGRMTELWEISTRK